MLNSLKVGHRLAAGFATVLILLGIISMLSLGRLASLKS